MKRSNKYSYRLAEQKDSDQILEILEENIFPGKIELTYTRRPNAYSSFMNDGSKVTILLCEDTENKKVIGFGIVSEKQVYINEKLESIGYLNGLRLREEYQKKAFVIHDAYKKLFELCSRNKIYLTTILNENTAAIKLLTRKRASIPEYIFFDNYSVFPIVPKKKENKSDSYNFVPESEENIDDILDFISEYGKKQNFFPEITKEIIREKKAYSKLKFYALYKYDSIVAAGAVWDQRNYKQTIIKKYNNEYRIFYHLKKVLNYLGYPELQKPGSVLNYFTLSYWAFKDNDKKYFFNFVDQISGISKDFNYFLIGVADSNVEIYKAAKSRSKLKYRSSVYTVKTGKDPIINTEQPSYFECGEL